MREGEFSKWLRHLVDMTGADKIMSATDAPHPNLHLRMPEWVKVFAGLGKEFSEEEKNMILGGTAMKVLKLEDRPGKSASRPQKPVRDCRVEITGGRNRSVRRLAHHQVEQFQGRRAFVRDAGGLRGAEIDARSLRNFIILLCERDDALAFHEVNEL